MGIGTLIGGVLPLEELSRLTNLELISLGVNSFDERSLPSAMGNMSNLRGLDLSFCGLTGTLLPELGNLPLLSVLVFHSNGLTGTIPEEYAKLTKLIVNLPSLF
mmetsp:Transcript_10391/g.24068  ORF Transcript_10391/g.24068 Transcript_10391/m.24068 type:complete len:104 (-) Transcript_10391:2172-2483(-)